MLAQATYLGGADPDRVYALAIGPTTGDVYAGGETGSFDFPGTSGGIQPLWAGRAGGFAARLGSALTSVRQATYLGGRDSDVGQAVAIAPESGDVYLAGSTFSADLPGASGGAQPARIGRVDAFIARLTSTLALLDRPPLDARASVNQPRFVAGQTLTLGMSLTNPGLPGTADLYLGGLLPDGVTIVFWTGGGSFAQGRLDDPRTFRPYAAGVSLTAPFVRDMPGFLSHQWADGDPRGIYVLFNLAVRAGALASGIASNDEVLALATAPFRFR